MPFDDIPEDRHRCFPCEACGCGTIVQNENDPSRWECTTCDWTAQSPRQEPIHPVTLADYSRHL
jgi:Zn-finger protein